MPGPSDTTSGSIPNTEEAQTVQSLVQRQGDPRNPPAKPVRLHNVAPYTACDSVSIMWLRVAHPIFLCKLYATDAI